MFTVTGLAKKCGLSRATLLYYEREGLLSPAGRGDNGYRWYGDVELKRLEAIAAYRSYGLPISEIKELLNRSGETDQATIMKEHFYRLEDEVEKLKKQQRAIVVLLQDPSLLKASSVSKQQWVAIMRAAGFDEKSMTMWHQKFEEMQPDKHQQFLDSLDIGADEIKRIRNIEGSHN